MLFSLSKTSCERDLREELLFAQPSLGFYCVRTLITAIIIVCPRTYAFNKRFSEECEAESIHDICENYSRQITFMAPDLFKYAYHYYYEYENSSYKMVDQVQNEPVFSGTYEMGGNRIVGAILAGEQAAAVQTD